MVAEDKLQLYEVENLKMTTSSSFQSEFPELKKTTGTPNFHTVLNLLQELKTNAQSDNEKLSDGDCSYLPLLLENLAFLALSNTTAAILPVNPPDLNILISTTQVQ